MKTRTTFSIACLIMLAACSSDPSQDASARDAGLVDAETSVPPSDAAPAPADAAVDDASPAEMTVLDCMKLAFPGVTESEIDYDQFHPIMGNHCAGTNHQDISAVERVVFLGDSVTVGTPPTLPGATYRGILADRLATRFGLTPPSSLWKTANPVSGQAVVSSSGDFAVCAKWGARTDDLLLDNHQIEDCIPLAQRDKRTLVIMTMGGNDIASITQDGSGELTVAELWIETQNFVQRMREAAEWFREPGRFPNGVFLVFANMYEYTDATGDVDSCAAVGAAGYEAWDDPQALRDMVIWANEQYMSIAVETGTDMVLMLEQFCGHGYHNDDPASICYRGPDSPRWLDATCIHPNPAGHEALAGFFEDVVAE